MIHRVVGNIEKVMIGKRDCVEKMMMALLCGGHVLIEDVPGVGKTTLAQALAGSLNCSFGRIQFTPDLVPSDLIGISLYNQKEGNFEFKKGPIHHQIVLADEINRTSPKTQSSLLEVMQEQQVTVDGTTYKMEDPFMVIATQNPIEYEGTFPLPEAQLDRFLMKISIGYPTAQEEMEMIRTNRNHTKLGELETVLTEDELRQAKTAVEEIYVSEGVEEYIVNIIRQTRLDQNILLGCSPRATISLYRVAKACAYVRDRTYVTPDDVKSVVQEVLGHRIIIHPEAKYKGYDTETVLNNILKRVNVPLVKQHA